MNRSDLKVTIDAESSKAEAALDRVRRSTLRMEDQLRKAELAAADLDRQLESEAAQAAAERAEAMETLGQGLVAFGAAVVGGLGFAAKAAADWESAWAGVRKTVDGSDVEIAALEAELRELALTLPASHQEIAAVAEAAGQLGVRVNDVAAFTKTMINLGETTDLTAEDAANALARISNIMGTSVSDVDRLGATLVDLGNNSAATEREIVEMALRIAGAGQQIGLTEAEVLAFAASLSSVGIEAEAGGTAISRVMIEISNAVAEGGDSLTGFADVAGMSTQEFARAFEQDPAAAIQAFVGGLSRIDQAGGNVFATLDELSLGEIRVRDALLRMSGAGDLLSETLDRGAEAWDANSALAEEAAKRYQTTESRVQLARNALYDFGIDVGSVLLPVLAEMADLVAGVAKWFADLPGPAKAALTILGGLVGVVSLLAGGFLLLAPRLQAVHQQMALLAGTAPRLAGALRILAFSVPAVGVLTAVAAGIAAIAGASSEAELPIGKLTKQLLDFRDGATSALVDQLATSFSRANDELATMEDRAAALVEFRRGMEDVDAVLTNLVQGGHIEQARDIIRGLRDQLGMSSVTVKEFANTYLPGYSDALATATTQTQLSEEAMAAQQEETSSAAQALQEMEDRAKGLDEALQVLNATLGNVEAESAYEQAIDDASARLREYREEVREGAAGTRGMKHAFDLGTQSGRENSAALRKLWEDASAYATKTLEVEGNQGKANRILKQGRQQLVDVATEFLGSRKKAEEYITEVLGIPKDVKTAINQPGMRKARGDTKDLDNKTRNVPNRKSITFRGDGLLGLIDGVINLIRELGNVPSEKTVTVRRNTVYYERQARAHGGLVVGPGTGTSDSIPASLSSGEYVVRAAAVAHYGPGLLSAINNLSYGGSASPVQAGAAAGGPDGGVSRSTTNHFHMKSIALNERTFAAVTTAAELRENVGRHR